MLIARSFQSHSRDGDEMIYPYPLLIHEFKVFLPKHINTEYPVLPTSALQLLPEVCVGTERHAYTKHAATS